MLPSLIQVQTDCLLEHQYLILHHICLPHVLNCLHQHPGMAALLRFETNHGKLVYLPTDFDLIKLGVECLQVFTQRVEQAEKERLLALKQVMLDLLLSLHELVIEVGRRGSHRGNVD